MINRIFVVLITAFCIFLGYTLYMALEYYSEETDLGWSSEALKNPFLALELFAQSNGDKVKVTDSYLELGRLNEYQFIYVSDSNLLLSEQRVTTLLEWVSAGGLLMVGVSSNEQDVDHFLNEINFTVHHVEYNDDEDHDYEDDNYEDTEDSAEAAAKSVGDALRQHNEDLNNDKTPEPIDDQPLTDIEIIARYEKEFDYSQLSELNFDGISDVLRAELDSTLYLYHPAMDDDEWSHNERSLTYWTGTDNGPHFAQLEVGAGLISLATGNALFDSNNIAHFNHAYLWQTLGGGGQSALLYGSNMPTLWSILKKVMPELLLSSFLLIACLICFSSGYFGSKKQYKSTSRRAFHEHLSASAAYFWRNKWQQKLLTPAREDVISAATARITEFGAASKKERIAALSKHCGIKKPLIHSALHQREQFTDDGFTKTVQVLQKLRGSL